MADSGRTPTQLMLANSLAETIERKQDLQPMLVIGHSSSDPGKKSPSAPPSIGRYIILRALGEGGMGVVYAAYDEELDRKVAVKLIHPSHQGDTQFRTRILREAQALARVSAPNVVTIYQVGEVDGQIFIAMEFINGTTATKWQAEATRTWQEILRMYTAAGQGLLAAHEAGLIHRDFKPDNVLVDKDGRPRVADFGLARMDAKAGTAAPMSMRVEAIRSNDALPLLSPVTQAGTLIGTPLYMSPEQHLGDPIDSRSDQFSFCVALYEALYGKLPFAGTTVESLGFNACSGKVQPRPTGSPVPMSVHRAILRGLAPHPSQRFPSMRELLAALNYDPTLDQTAGPRVRRRVTMSMLAFMFIVLMGMNLLDKLGVSPQRASLVTAFAYFALFVFLTFLFRRAFKNPFHRGMMVYGLCFGAQVLVMRVVGLALGLSHVQAVTLDLVAMAAMSAVAALLVLPTLWPLIPISLGSAVVAVLCPQLAQAVSSGAIVLGSSTALLLWGQRVKKGGLRTAKPWWKTDRHTPVPRSPS